MKKFICLALALMMVLALCACGSDTSSTPASNTDTPASSAPADEPATEPEAPADEPATEPEANEPASLTMTEGVLTVATSPDYAPYEFYALDAEGNPILAGFDMALAQYIADELGLTLEVVPMSFNGIVGEMAAGSADLAIAGLSPDPERQEAMDFSEIYYAGKQAFITVAANAEKFTDLESTNSADYSIGAQTGAIQMDLANQYSPESDIVSLPKATDIIAELLSGKLDGAYVEWDVAVAYQQNYPELTIVCEVPYDAEGNVIGVAKGNTALLDAVNAALTKCVEEGTFAQYVADALELAAGATASYVEGEIIDDNSGEVID